MAISFDEFYNKKMKHVMKNGETFNEIQESLFTLEEKERYFGYIEFDDDDNIWVTDIDDGKTKVKIESMDDFYAALAKYKLVGENKRD